MADPEKKKTETPQQPAPAQEDSAPTTGGDKEVTWAHDALQELEDFIESQGIYIRQ